ncbi:MAG: SPOR domain-containing protein [Bacteroidales bacterium]|jgi:hypothetical protein|nr:SPOR domain-containing protein [Bacteroidales bacterium]
MKRFFLLVIAMVFFRPLFAQIIFPDECQIENNQENLYQTLNIDKDHRLDKMLNWHIQNNKRRESIEGYRVEIFFSTNNRQKALDKKIEFVAQYPECDVYVLFISPNFRVRVGDFRTKNEAVKLLKKIEKDYSAAFVVKDNINFPLTAKPIIYE